MDWLIATGAEQSEIETEMEVVSKPEADALIVRATKSQISNWCAANCGVAFRLGKKCTEKAALSRLENGDPGDID